MERKNSRAQIIVFGLVQGVGFRYFVYRKAAELNLVGDESIWYIKIKIKNCLTSDSRRQP
ncbi:MAG: acylphosphatase [Ignavibacteriaceae bacterium]